jgi:hypothetical protein
MYWLTPQLSDNNPLAGRRVHSWFKAEKPGILSNFFNAAIHPMFPPLTAFSSNFPNRGYTNLPFFW